MDFTSEGLDLWELGDLVLRASEHGRYGQGGMVRAAFEFLEGAVRHAYAVATCLENRTGLGGDRRVSQRELHRSLRWLLDRAREVTSPECRRSAAEIARIAREVTDLVLGISSFETLEAAATTTMRVNACLRDQYGPEVSRMRLSIAAELTRIMSSKG